MSVGGIVLCGGYSRRMGWPKALLPFGQESMLQRVVRLVSEVARPVVVVAAFGEKSPGDAFATRAGDNAVSPIVVHDRQPDRGPLEGIVVGLARLRREAEHESASATVSDIAFVTACDAPLLRPAFIRRMIELADGYDAVVPHVATYDHPLSAVYRTAVLPCAELLLAAGRLRPAYLFDEVRTRRVAAEELVDVDPDLESLMNVNSPADYAAALVRAGAEG